MAKKEIAKKEFAWDSEVLLKTVEVSEKERHDILLCTLNEKTFVVDQKSVLKKDGWAVVKNSTMPLAVFEAAYEAVSAHKFQAAFEEAPKPKRTKKAKA